VTGIVPFIYGATNWSGAKYPLVIMICGNIFSFIGIVLLVVTVGPDFLSR